MRQGQTWVAHVQDTFAGFQGSFELPVYIEMGTSIQNLAQHSPDWIKCHIRVCQPAKDKKGCVWVGAQGLKGGGDLSKTLENGEIHRAIEDDKYEEFLPLIRRHRNIVHELDTNLKTPLHYAAHNRKKLAFLFFLTGNVHTKSLIINHLLSQGACIDAQDNQGKTPLHYAIDVLLAMALVQGGATINIQDNEGRTPLHNAADYDRLELVQLFLQRGANQEISDKKGSRPLHYAVGNKDIAQLLIANGASTEAKDNEGKTPLFNAVKNKNLETIRLLIEKGANKEARDDAGNTSLHQAMADFLDKAKDIESHFSDKEESLQKALQEAQVVVELLRELGDNPSIKNNQEKSPIHLAFELSDSALVKQLLDALRIETYQDQAGYTVFTPCSFG